KMRSTPTPFEILRTVNVSETPAPRREMHTPSKACRRSFSPSLTRTLTRSVSPERKGGMVFIHSFWVSINGCISASRRYWVEPRNLVAFKEIYKGGSRKREARKPEETAG